MDVSFSELRKVFGPAWLTMMANVEAASIITAMQTAALFKYQFIIIILLLIIPLYFICEIAGRVGSATGMGLGELVRRNFSKRMALLLSVPMAATDLLSYVAEYAAIAVGMEIIGISPLVTLPLVYLLHIAIVYKKKYAAVEKALLALSMVMVVVYLLFMTKGVSNYPFIPKGISHDFLFLVAANVGAVIMPFMLFYQTSATAKKEYRSVQATKVETFVGAVFSEILVVAIMVVSARLNADISITSLKSLGTAIISIGGTSSAMVFSIGLVSAGFLALVVISMSGAWGIAEALGVKDKTWFKIYVLESLPAVIAALLLPNLIMLVLYLMVALVFVLIGPVVTMGLLAENKEIMGRHSLRGFGRMAFWASVAVVMACGFLAFI